MNKDELLQKAKTCFKVAYDAEAGQREREKEDLEFQVPDLQWDPAARKERAGNSTTPPRPMLSISLLSQPVQLILNQASSAQLGVEIHPISEDADEELAEIKQGLYRRIERDSNADMARLWALSRAVHCGRGWYRVNTQYDDDSDQTGDQEIVIDRILNQEDVFVDPAAKKPDCSDARWIMVTSWVPVEAFKEMWPNKEVPTNLTELLAWAKDEPEWVKASEEYSKGAVLVAEYFYKEYEKDRVTGVKYCKLTAKDILEEQDWNGKHIPLIPVWGRELIPFDGERRFEGVVRLARDGQRLANYTVSTGVEYMALQNKSPWIGAEGQFEGHEHEWEQANVRNFPYLQYKPTTVAGAPAPPPSRAPVDTSGVGLFFQGFQQARDLVQQTTAVFAPSLGEMPQDQTAQSGRAILALQQQSDAGTSHFLKNLAKVSMRYEAMVILDLMPKIYDRPGRITQILTAEDEPKTIMVNAPFKPNAQGRPQPVPPEMMPPPMPGQPEELPEGVKNYDLSRGRYAVSISVGKSFQTRLQEGQAEIGGILEKNPALMPVVGDLYFKFRDFPGAKEISDRLKRMREQQFPGLGGEDEEGMTLQKAMTMLQQLQQQQQQLTQQLNEATQALETDKAKQEATILKAQLDAATKKEVAELEAKVRLMLEGVKGKVKSEEVAFKVADSADQREHEVDMQDDQQAHEVGIETMKHVAQKDRDFDSF